MLEKYQIYTGIFIEFKHSSTNMYYMHKIVDLHVLILLANVLSVLLRFTSSDYTFGIFKPFIIDFSILKVNL